MSRGGAGQDPSHPALTHLPHLDPGPVKGPGLGGLSAACPHQLCDLRVPEPRSPCLRREQRPDPTGTARQGPHPSYTHPTGGWWLGTGGSEPAPPSPAQTSGQAHPSGTLTLMTGGVGGTTGMTGVTGGGGAAAGGTGTDVTFAVMVGTGVAAMTGVWETAGGTFWKGVAGETEGMAATCCVPWGQGKEAEQTRLCPADTANALLRKASRAIPSRRSRRRRSPSSRDHWPCGSATSTEPTEPTQGLPPLARARVSGREPA